MKKLMVANVQNNDCRYSKSEVELLLNAQIENSLDLGWNKDNIIIVSNIDYSFMGVKTIKTNLNDFCLTGSKMFALFWLIKNNMFNDIIHASDLDCWQNIWFDVPIIKDVGIATYSKPKFNGGSVFWKPSSKDIIYKIVDNIIKNKANKEEPILNSILKSDEYKDRVTILNNTYNVGCSGFVPRYINSFKPIRVCHFNIRNRVAWETHTLDRNGIGAIPVSRRLERLLRKYFINLPIKLKGDHHGTKNKKRIKIKVITESFDASSKEKM